MAAKGYTTAALVADWLGVTLTAAQQTHAATLIEQAESAIDDYCHRGWLMGTQTNEIHRPYGRAAVYLKYAPISSVTTVLGRSGLGEAEETLTVDDDYEVMDVESGYIRLVYPASYDRVRITYEPRSTIPKAIERAATELVAMWIQSHLRPDTYGLEMLQLPDMTVRWSRQYLGGMPPAVMALLEPYVYRSVA